MILIKNAQLYAPEKMGICDILIEGSRISEIGKEINVSGIQNLELMDVKGKRVTPGFIDIHTHIIGGGGEKGPSSMVRESYVTDFTRAGVTTTVGLLGTDGVIRNVESLLIKAKALNSEGLTVKVLTGSYSIPSITISGDIEKDIILFEEIIGCKVALEDHRGSYPSYGELLRIVERSRRGGLLSNKAGLVTIHMGNGKYGLSKVIEILKETQIPAKNIIPTHMASRGYELLDQAIEFINMGGSIDISSGESLEANMEIVRKIRYLNQKVSLDNITVSSDAFGSLPKFDEHKNLIGYSFAKPEFNLDLLKILMEDGYKLEEVLPMFTSNPARAIAMDGTKGKVEENYDADLVVFDDSLNVETVISKGRMMIKDKEILVKGLFE